MFRQSKAAVVEEFFSSPLAKNQVAVFYLGTSGFLIRTVDKTVVIDPAGFLKNDEVKALKNVAAVLFTHSHLDHFNSGKTQTIFKATGAAILAEPKVAEKLKGKIPVEKLFSAESEKSYDLDGVAVRAVQGIHRGPIMLYQTKLGSISLFHAGDSGYVPLKEYQSDVALLPTGRMSPTASPENAYKMAVDLKPQIAVAMHGSEKQKRQFEAKVKETLPFTEVLIMEPFSSKIISLQSKP